LLPDGRAQFPVARNSGVKALQVICPTRRLFVQVESHPLEISKY
jgi:hypothetical protein